MQQTVEVKALGAKKRKARYVNMHLFACTLGVSNNL